MKTITILVAILVCLGLTVPGAHAANPAKAGKTTKKEQKASANIITRYDRNGNGFIDADEVGAIQKAFKTDPALKHYDKNGDGKLDDEEVSAINPMPKKKKK